MEAHDRTEKLSASPPLFKSEFLNFFSRVHPAVPAVIFVPVVVAMEWLGIDRGYGALSLILLTLAGIGIWTLTEYWLHRLVFHWEPDNAFGRRMHFIIHGIHHDHPNDKMRLVMPPSVLDPAGRALLRRLLADLRQPRRLPALRRLHLRLPRLRLHALLRAPFRAEVRSRQAAARAAHAPPLPGPPLRLRRLLPALGRRSSAPCRASATASAPLALLTGSVRSKRPVA